MTSPKIHRRGALAAVVLAFSCTGMVRGAGVPGLAERPANETCVDPGRPVQMNAGVTTERVFPNLQFYRATNLLLEDDQFFVTLQEGKIMTFPNDPDATEARVWVDLEDRVTGHKEGGGEMGLLGLAFHPEFKREPIVFINYTTTLPDGTWASRVSKFRSNDAGKTLDKTTEEILIEIGQPQKAHNGGRMLWGPDGYLYISMGDGGGFAGFAFAEDPMDIRGAILRIDPLSASPYAIPADNPFADGKDGAPEIYAYGFRNPWGWDFDRQTGDLWLGDVGADTHEELNKVVKGGNYGWPIWEGPLCRMPNKCENGGFIEPVWSYTHEVGDVIVAGPVYRGRAIPSLYGKLLVSDYISGETWGMTFDAAGKPDVGSVLKKPGFKIAGFTELPDAELLILEFSYKGGIHKLLPVGAKGNEAAAGTGPSAKLSQTGCVDPERPGEPAAGVIPYDIVAEAWSDGLDRQRWMALPDGKAISIEEGGEWALPTGSVVMQELSHSGTPIETRFLINHANMGWAGYTYVWDDDGKDATLMRDGHSIFVGDQLWKVPNDGQCTGCHTEAAGFVLGLEDSQVQGKTQYAGGMGDQQATLRHVGILPSSPGSALVDPYADGDLDARARSWLHTNCSSCHRPGGPGGGDFDLRVSTPLAGMGACGSEPVGYDMGLTGGSIIAPGDPDLSILAARIAAAGPGQMPPLGRGRIDTEGLWLVREWIRQLEDCDG